MATFLGSYVANTTSDWWNVKIEIYEGTANVANNTSPVTVDVYIGRYTVGSYFEAPYINCTVSCTGVSNQSFVYNSPAHVDIGTGEFYKIGSVTFSAVPHNDDGSKTVTIGASFTNTIKPSSGSVSGSVTLATIARASQPSLINFPDSISNVGSFGTEISIHMNRKSSNFTHTVRYEFGSTSETIATGVTTGCKWTIPTKLMNQLPSSTSGSGRVYVDTYNGSTFVGTKYTGFTATVPESVKPSVSFTLTDVSTGVGDVYGKPVKGLSKIKIVVSATPAYSSPIASYTIQANGTTYYSSTVTTGVLLTAGNSPVTATVKDSRGRTNSYSYTMSVLDYNPPAITGLSAFRINDAGEPDNSGGGIRIRFSSSVTSLNNKNVANYVLSTKKSSDSQWNDENMGYVFGTNSYTLTDAELGITADKNSSYDIKITVHDRHNTTSRSTSASTAFTLMNFHESGTAVGIGKVAENENLLDVGLPTKFNNGVDIKYLHRDGLWVTSWNDVPSALDSIYNTMDNYSVTFNSLNVNGVGAILELGKIDASYGYALLKRYASDGMGMFQYSKYGGAWTSVSTILDHGRYNLNLIYPVGSIYLAYNHTSPASLFGGTWTRIENYFLWAVGADGTVGGTGGSKTHTLTTNEMPYHEHFITEGGMTQFVYTSTKSPSGTGDNYLTRLTVYGRAWHTDTDNTYRLRAQATGGGAAHNNMPPYIQISAWRRTA